MLLPSFNLPFSDKTNHVAKIIFVAVVYYVAGHLNVLFFSSTFDDYLLQMGNSHKEFPFYWPPPGLMLGLLMVMGRSVWPGVAIGSLLLTPSNFLFEPEHLGVNLTVVLSYASARTLEALTGYHLLKKWSSGNYLSSVKETFIFIAVAALISPIGSGLSAFVIDFFTTEFQLTVFIRHWVSWYGDNLVGVLLFTPLVFAFTDLKGKEISKREVVTFIMFLLFWFVLFHYVSNMNNVSRLFVHSRPFIALPLLFFLALRYHAFVSILAVIFVSLASAYSTSRGIGPFAEMGNPLDTRILLQSFFAVASVSSLFLNSSAKEIKQYQKNLGRLSLVAKETSNYVFVTNIDWEIEWVNASFEKATGYRLDEIKGSRPNRFLHGKNTSESTREYIVQMVQDQKPFTSEIIYYTKTGEEFWVQINCQPMADESGITIGFFAIMLNITDQKKLIASLEEARKKAEESDQLKSAFIANMSHEIRTPMNAIMGFSELLEQSFPEEKRKLFTRMIRQRSEDLLTIVNDVLDISKIEAGQESSVPTNGNMQDFLNVLVTSHQDNILHLQNRKVELKWFNELKGNENVVVADFQHLNQVLHNLLTNALKFTHEGFIELGCQLQNNTLLFSVRDSGIGISKDKQEAIFKPFRQADKHVHQKYGGTGLGLAICKGFIQLWGGKIWIESEEGKGATFFFTMPYTPQLNSDGSNHGR